MKFFKTPTNAFKRLLNGMFSGVRCHSDFRDLKIRFFLIQSRPSAGERINPAPVTCRFKF
ncbi:MAG: hypothetical protein K2J08_05140 [Ruminococcus sp.]|nr:hypothetical protein [Ruminococcus sp.]